MTMWDEKVMTAAFRFDILKQGDRHFKGKLADMIFDRVRRTRLTDRFAFMSSLVLQREYPWRRMLVNGKLKVWREEPTEGEIAGAKRTINFFFANSDIFTTEDIRFVLTKVAHGRGHPTFDYIGVDKTSDRKVLLDVKSGSGKYRSIVFSSNEQVVVREAKTLAFDIYIAFITFLKNWEAEMRLIKL